MGWVWWGVEVGLLRAPSMSGCSSQFWLFHEEEQKEDEEEEEQEGGEKMVD